MSYKLSDDLSDAVLAEVKSALDGGFLYFFAGPVPEAPEDALDMVSDHTHLSKISVDDDGVTGLTFDAPSGAVMLKADAEAWEGTATFDGADDEGVALLATFFRFCTSSDDGRGAGAAPRLQGTVGLLGSGADMEREDPTITASEPLIIGSYIVRVSSIA